MPKRLVMISTLPEFTETSGDDGPPAVQVEVTAEKKANQELAEQIEPNANELEEVSSDSASVSGMISDSEDLDSSVEDQNDNIVLPRPLQVQPVPHLQMPDHPNQSGLRYRKKKRIDGLGHLSPAGGAVQAAEAPRLRVIARDLVQLDIWALKTFKQSYDSYPDATNKSIYQKFKALMSDEVVEVVGDEDHYDTQYEQDIRDLIDNLPDSRILEMGCDLRTTRYYATFVQQRVQLYESAVEEQKYALNTASLTLPEQPTWLKTPQQYLTHLGKEVSENRQRLVLLVQGSCLRLRECIKSGVRRNELSQEVLGSLCRKLKALDVNYAQGYLIIHGEPRSLVISGANGEIDWNAKAGEIEIPRAQPRAIDSNAFLLFMVPTTCVVSCFLACLAWIHTPPQIGSSNDGNFYQLLSSSLMQLLGIFTLALALLSKNFVGLPRILACALVGTSILCTVVSMPLYLYAPTAWSGLMSFLGNCAQALVLLQFVFHSKPTLEQ